jgi:hypothetical protein
MQQALMAALSVHVLAATFWAGSTFASTRTGGGGSERLFGPQMGAAAIAVLTGAYLWRALHEGSFGPMEQLLSAGALCALLAIAVQAVIVGSAIGKLRRRGSDDNVARSRIVVAHRVATVLLVVATVCMAAARYA